MANRYELERMNLTYLPISVVIPTRNRVKSLAQTLECLVKQSCFPTEVLVVDSSTNNKTIDLIENWSKDWPEKCRLEHLTAKVAGAAPQRNQGVESSTQKYTMFLDDDIYFKENCLNEIWMAMNSGTDVVGVTPIYEGESYQAPGKFGSRVMAFLNGKTLQSYAGRAIGPGFTRLPDASDDLDQFVQIDWMGSGCALYRTEDLPSPPFPSVFKGASLFEDLCLSLTVGRLGRILNARMARAIHANEGGDHKRNRFKLAKMELINRYYIMRIVLRQRGLVAHFKFFVMMMYMTLGAFWHPFKWDKLFLQLAGMATGVLTLPFLDWNTSK